MKSSTTKVPNGHGSVYKEVRFSPTATPVRRAQSVSTSTPASNLDCGRVLGTRGDTSSHWALSSNYLDQSRLLLDRQRANFANERALFAEERQLWEKERALLKLRISELESLLRNKGPAGTASTSAFALNSFGGPLQSTNLSHQSHFQRNHSQVWEGSSPVNRPTRVFPDAEKIDGHAEVLSNAEQGGNLLMPVPSLLAQFRTVDFSTTTSVPVPIQKLDSKLDGIILKSTALPPEVVARVMTPPSPSPQEVSPSFVPQKTPAEHKSNLRLKLSELGPPDKNLVRDAGHTPMVVIDADADTGLPSPNEGAPNEPNQLDELNELNELAESEKPLAPVPTVRQPAENSDSYFPDLPEDPALKGPLSLLNDEEHDSEFLQELNQKLLDQARKIVGRSSDPEDHEESDAETSSHLEQVPELKFKNTTNFGTAFGIADCNKD